MDERRKPARMWGGRGRFQIFEFEWFLTQCFEFAFLSSFVWLLSIRRCFLLYQRPVKTWWPWGAGMFATSLGPDDACFVIAAKYTNLQLEFKFSSILYVFIDFITFCFVLVLVTTRDPVTWLSGAGHALSRRRSSNHPRLTSARKVYSNHLKNHLIKFLHFWSFYIFLIENVLGCIGQLIWHFVHHTPMHCFGEGTKVHYKTINKHMLSTSVTAMFLFFMSFNFIFV